MNLSRIGSTLKHEKRKLIMKALNRSANPLAVKEIQRLTNTSNKMCSWHLSMLRKAELVQRDRDGKFQRYSLSDTGKQVIRMDKRLSDMSDIAHQTLDDE